ncbi:MAG: hypothetical protein V4622_13115 [Bacteroidota bacterium]
MERERKVSIEHSKKMLNKLGLFSNTTGYNLEIPHTKIAHLNFIP